MPELPEVETMCRGDQTHCWGGDSTRRTSPLQATSHTNSVDAEPTTLRATDRRGSIVWANGRDRHPEPRTTDLRISMTGLVLIDQAPSEEHKRFRLMLDECEIPELLFWDRRGLGVITLLSDDEYRSQLLSGKLGPDALTITDAEPSHAFPKRVDQSKSLFSTSPVGWCWKSIRKRSTASGENQSSTPCIGTDETTIQKLNAAIRFILNQAIRYEGSTLSDGTYRNAINGEGGFQNHHKVYDREGDPCPTCRKSPIKRISAAIDFLCERCQR
ncbi:MAG: DNA-formamidopyrimidine glycosylase family protein [Pirellulaceae bacterium]